MFGEWQSLLVGNGQGTQVSKWSLLARKSPHAVMRVTVINWESYWVVCANGYELKLALMPDCSVRTTDRYIVTWICLILQKQENSFPVDSTTGGLSKGEITNHLQQIKGATPTVPTGYLGTSTAGLLLVLVISFHGISLFLRLPLRPAAVRWTFLRKRFSTGGLLKFGLSLMGKAMVLDSLGGSSPFQETLK